MRAKILGMVVAALVSLAAPAWADQTHPWDASWFGGFGGNSEGVQIIVAGNQVVGFFFAGEYLDIAKTNPIAADGSLTFTWDGGTATMSAPGGKAALAVHKAGSPDAVIPLSRDP